MSRLRKVLLGFGVVTTAFSSYVGYRLLTLDEEIKAFARGSAVASLPGQLHEAQAIMQEEIDRRSGDGQLVDVAWLSMYQADLASIAGQFNEALEGFGGVERAFSTAGEALPCSYYARRCQAYLHLDPATHAADIKRDALLAIAAEAAERELDVHLCGANCYSYAQYCLFMAAYHSGAIQEAEAMLDDGMRDLIHPLDKPMFEEVVAQIHSSSRVYRD